MTKKEIVEGLSKPSYSQHEVRLLVQSVKEENGFRKVQKVKYGDVFIFKHEGMKPRPFVIIKIENEITALAMSLTTCEDHMAMRPFKNRFLEGGFFSANVQRVHIGTVKENFICLFDDKKDLRMAIAQWKQMMEKL